MKTKILSVFFVMNLFLASLVIPSFQTEAMAQFPSFMSGSETKIKSFLNKKGKGTLNILALVGIMIAAGCLIFGSFKLSTNNGQGAKGYIIGSMASLVLIALVYSVVVFFGKI